ncbi:hypothetical protein SUGI_1097710 [Cryptomeria japonica]|uniref:uncharacterized protein LOC131036460 n=1 Tax=Cryptomeria japonica TaxID=3369 RepID=UPI0024147A0E|nr:uncharacterized protein LOC131036460 [Cryptomeria japonica]GLJ51655.1 hypothetical protein SUGI_1097710 [Cryptomeria japonica]
METLQLNSFSHAHRLPSFCRQKVFPSLRGRWKIFAVTRTTRSDNELSAKDLFKLFLKERQLEGDFITKTSDKFWTKEVLEVDKQQIEKVNENVQPQKISEKESGGFLKLSRTKSWVSGNDEAPVNEIYLKTEWKTDRENRRRIGLLEYEALKRELFLITAGIGAACTGYCYFVFSPQVALSYAAGAVASCFYLRLLYHHADNISKEKLAEVFTRKKVKKIGIRSDDIRELFEKISGGTTMALSSPRLVIPAALFGFWDLSKHLFANSLDFEIAPAILGLFAYKAAALVQAYRDNEDLLISFMKDEENSDS